MLNTRIRTVLYCVCCAGIMGIGGFIVAKETTAPPAKRKWRADLTPIAVKFPELIAKRNWERLLSGKEELFTPLEWRKMFEDIAVNIYTFINCQEDYSSKNLIRAIMAICSEGRESFGIFIRSNDFDEVSRLHVFTFLDLFPIVRNRLLFPPKNEPTASDLSLLVKQIQMNPSCLATFDVYIILDCYWEMLYRAWNRQLYN